MIDYTWKHIPAEILNFENLVITNNEGGEIKDDSYQDLLNWSFSYKDEFDHKGFLKLLYKYDIPVKVQIVASLLMEQNQEIDALSIAAYYLAELENVDKSKKSYKTVGFRCRKIGFPEIEYIDCTKSHGSWYHRTDQTKSWHVKRKQTGLDKYTLGEVVGSVYKNEKTKLLKQLKIKMLEL